ncbi:unnamed protein product [Pocillopora meandrina]|uniref:Shugoshin C-terminal domain-containing protein n=1 Tax=Pocillopora meandrina TaxID=46732 RepID=A0AAU9VW48_9CNID|nr:unnamed protein product [Pocillopora meandrina]
MGERTPRRGNNILFSAQQLDHNASKARHLNKRAGNRLQIRKGSLEEQQSTQLQSLDYEMRRLKHELREITQTSGKLEMRDTIIERPIPGKVDSDNNTRRKKSKRAASTRNNLDVDSRKVGNSTGAALNNDDAQDSRRKSLSLPTLPSMSTATPQLTSRTDFSRVDENEIDESFTSPRVFSKPREKRRKHSRSRKLNLDVSPAAQNLANSTDGVMVNVSITNTNGDTERLRPVSPQGSSKLDSSLVNVNLVAVKDRIQTRLSQPTMNKVNDGEDDDEPDYTQYLHVPPDGLPRTVYLLPPLTDLLQEAKKARYIRRPRKPLQELEGDDPDRELGIDEIFSKKG